MNYSSIQKTFIFYETHLLLTDDALPCYQMELVELQNCDALKDAFRANSLIDFCASLPNSTFPNIKKHDLKMSTIYCSTYICEQTFSRIKLMNTTIRSRISDEHLHQRLAVTRMELSWTLTFSPARFPHQAYSSH